MRKYTEKTSKKGEEGSCFYNNECKKDSETIITDPLGSWTGIPTDDIYDTPVQDADDL